MNLVPNHAITEPASTNHLELTDDEVRLLELLMASLGYEKRFHLLCSGLHAKLTAFGLSRKREVYHTTLAGQKCHFENRDPCEICDGADVGGGMILVPGRVGS